MSLLDDLTKDNRETIIRLPYRVGLWVSQADTTGGQEAADQEVQALSNIIEGFAHEVFGSELVQYIMAETVAKKDEWPDWSAGRDSVLADCGLAVDILRDHTDEKDVSAFKARLMEIAEAIALAFSEYEEASAADKIFSYMSYFLEKIRTYTKKTSQKSLDEYLSISRQERGALGDLARALGI